MAAKGSMSSSVEGAASLEGLSPLSRLLVDRMVPRAVSCVIVDPVVVCWVMMFRGSDGPGMVLVVAVVVAVVWGMDVVNVGSACAGVCACACAYVGYVML